MFTEEPTIHEEPVSLIASCHPMQSGIFIWDEMDEEWRLTLRYSEIEITATEDDYFEAMCAIRVSLEVEGMMPNCYGASRIRKKAMNTPLLSPEETARRGDEIYERQIRSRVETGNYGKIVAIDVETGSYALEETAVAASRQLQALQPSAEVWLVRVGHRGLHHIGASSVRKSQ